jgi:protein-L-isoaspartate(D-aspartate) O-methyltransferase
MQLTTSESPLVRRLVEQGVRDASVLEAFARVPRAAFVPDGLRDLADEDRPLGIGWGQTISQPYIVAAMTAALRLQGDERVLEVGTGSGYQTAILCELLGARATVRSIEIIPELLERAAATLARLGCRTELRLGDGAEGWPEAAPYDAILVAAAPLEVPPALLRQLAIGGRLVIPVGPTPERQELQLWTRQPDGGFDHRTLLPVRFVPLVSRH